MSLRLFFVNSGKSFFMIKQCSVQQFLISFQNRWCNFNFYNHLNNLKMVDKLPVNCIFKDKITNFNVLLSQTEKFISKFIKS